MSNQKKKNVPVHKLSEEDKQHLKRSGRYIPPVRLNMWQKSQIAWDKIPGAVQKIFSVNYLSKAVSASVILGAVTFIAGEGARRQAQVYQAWAIVNSAHGQAGNGGRIEALEFLNSQPRRIPWFWLRWEREDLSGLNLPNAYLSRFPNKTLVYGIKKESNGIQLPNAYLSFVNFQKAVLFGANLKSAYLDSANFEIANLEYANLQGAYLGSANLKNANLQGTNLQDTFLRFAHLQGANLRSANLRGADLDFANLQGVDLRGVKYSITTKKCENLIASCPISTVFPRGFDPVKADMVLVKPDK